MQQQQVVSTAPGLEATRIVRHLWIGSRPPPGRPVARAGFDILVLCALGHEYAAPPARLRMPAYAPELASFPGLGDVVHAPLDDGLLTEEESDRARWAARGTARAIQDGRRVLVTCMQGRNRSGLVCALTLHYLLGVSGSAAALEVQRRRRTALMNPDFVRYLETVPPRRR